MFVQSEQFVEAHGGNVGKISIYGQDSEAARQVIVFDREGGATHQPL